MKQDGSVFRVTKGSQAAQAFKECFSSRNISSRVGSRRSSSSAGGGSSGGGGRGGGDSGGGDVSGGDDSTNCWERRRAAAAPLSHVLSPCRQQPPPGVGWQLVRVGETAVPPDLAVIQVVVDDDG